MVSKVSRAAAPKGMQSCTTHGFFVMLILFLKNFQGVGLRGNRQLRAVMDSGTLALLYFDVILLDGSRAAAPKGMMSRRTHGEL